MSFSESVFFVLSQESAGEDIPIMLLGNKTDKEMERQVQKGVGERLAKVCLYCQLIWRFLVDIFVSTSLLCMFV